MEKIISDLQPTFSPLSNDMTLKDIARHAKKRGVRFFVYCAWCTDEGSYFKISKNEFFRAIGSYIDNTRTTAHIDDSGDLYIN